MFRFFVKLAAIFLIYLAFQRFIFLFLFSAKWNYSWDDLNAVIVAGGRFDLMCFGYISLPCLILLSVQAIFRDTASEFFFQLSRTYLIAVVIILGLVGFADLLWFSQFEDRFSEAHTWQDLLAAQHINAFFCLAFVFSLLWTLRFVLGMKSLSMDSARRSGIWSWIFSLLFLAFVIRGSVDAHHLDLRHSNVTHSRFLNLSCVSSPYALDQALRHRR